MGNRQHCYADAFQILKEYCPRHTHIPKFYAAATRLPSLISLCYVHLIFVEVEELIKFYGGKLVALGSIAQVVGRKTYL